MKILQFKCTLLTDIVLSETSATTGMHRSLDFIPGNNFLGIAAKTLYDEENERTLTIFHSGKVRFGDAHPAAGDIRGLKIPAAMYYPKLGGMEAGLYVHHLITDHAALAHKQLKQCRKGFYAFDEDKREAILCTTEKDFSIKSSYDARSRRSKDSGMFGYESLCSGITLFFDVEIDDDVEAYAELIQQSLLGKRHVGRSRTAQYGLVQIDECRFSAPTSTPYSNSEIAVYADARLIFFDSNANPTFRPTPADLGIDDDRAQILWEKSQIRTFAYSPWNYKRQAFDNTRCGIEKGSVFIVSTSVPAASLSLTNAYLGRYRAEGFGKVIYNPTFLQAHGETGQSNALAAFLPKEGVATHKCDASEPSPIIADTPLIAFLKRQQKTADVETDIFRDVNDFVKCNAKFFRSEAFASQWGSIRSLAMVISDPGELTKAILAYLGHGVAKDKWEERDRIGKLEKFMQNHKEANLQALMINLASQMAKKCKRDK